MRRLSATLAILALLVAAAPVSAAGGVRFSGATCTYTGSSNAYSVSVASTIITSVSLTQSGADIGTRSEVRLDNAYAFVAALSATATGYSFALNPSSQSWAYAAPPEVARLLVRDGSNNSYTKTVACKAGA